jgi:hypothetical protein
VASVSLGGGSRTVHSWAGAGFNWTPSATSVDAGLAADALAIGGRVLTLNKRTDWAQAEQ